jgi:hypothetical protein
MLNVARLGGAAGRLEPGLPHKHARGASDAVGRPYHRVRRSAFSRPVCYGGRRSSDSYGGSQEPQRPVPASFVDRRARSTSVRLRTGPDVAADAGCQPGDNHTGLQRPALRNYLQSERRRDGASRFAVWIEPLTSARSKAVPHFHHRRVCALCRRRRQPASQPSRPPPNRRTQQ